MLKSHGQQDQTCGLLLHVQEEGYQSTLTFRKRVARYLPRMMPLIHPAKIFDLLVLHIPVLF